MPPLPDDDPGDDLPICVTCGVQYGAPRPDCPVCLDERQYVGRDGQRWTSVAGLRAAGHRGRVEAEGDGADGVVGIGVEPAVAIGQRALLVRGPSGGNVLWDCVPYLDDDLARRVEGLGGVDAVAVSHPHFHGAMVTWARAFGAPAYVHAADRGWVARPDPSVVFWDGDRHQLAPGLTLLNLGVHFAGGTVLHRAAAGGGDLFSGDIVQVVPDRRWVSFMYSYPNLIPERPRTVRRALALLEPLDVARVYGGWWGRVVDGDGAAALRRSGERYLRFALDDGPGGG